MMEGAVVVIANATQADADATAKELAYSGRRAFSLALDVTNEAEVEAGITKTVETFGRIDILVSNAGMQTTAPLDVRRLLEEALLISRAAWRQMCIQRGGSIIYTETTDSKEAIHLGPCVTAKCGVIGLANVIAKEGVRYGVRANAIRINSKHFVQIFSPEGHTPPPDNKSRSVGSGTG